MSRIPRSGANRAENGPNPPNPGQNSPNLGQNGPNPGVRRLAPTSQVGFARFPTRPPHPPTSAIWVAQLADLQVTSDLIHAAEGDTLALAICHIEGGDRPLDGTVQWVMRVFEMPDGWREEDPPSETSKTRFIFCAVDQ